MTFATPWGRYRWLRMPFGISPAPEEFQRRLNESLEGLEGVRAVADDILLCGVGETDAAASRDHDIKICKLFDRLKEKGIKVNKNKLKLRRKEVTYLGHKLTSEGLKPDDKKVEAILAMPSPTDRKGVKRPLGMTNYLQKFAPHLSEVNAPLRDLLKDGVQFEWDDQIHGVCFDKVKRIISEAPVLKYFDEKEPDVTLQCDASQSGIAACLLQRGQPVCYAARAMTAVEENYAQIEKELLAIVFGVRKHETYLYGRQFNVESDHKPLETIFKKSLLSAPKRLQAMLLALQKFDMTISYKRGSKLYLADTLSRAFVPREDKTCSSETSSEICYNIDITGTISKLESEFEKINMCSHLPISETTLNKIKQATKEDKSMDVLVEVIQKGWPELRSHVPEEISDFYTFKEELSVQDGLIYKGHRLIIPASIRCDIMKRLHSSHLGIQSCIRRASESVYWPRMSQELQEFI